MAEERLASSSIRLTPGRKAVVHLLGNAEGPLSATEIHDSLAGVPLSTIYRTLSVLEEAGVLVPHHATGVTRYEVADWIAGHHHHVICDSCGAVEDIVLPTALEDTIEEVVRAVAASAGHLHHDHSLEIHGLCSSCQ